MDVKIGGTVSETINSLCHSKVITVDTASIRIAPPIPHRNIQILHRVAYMSGMFQGKCSITINTHDAYTENNAYSANAFALAFYYHGVSRSDYEKKLAFLTQKFGQGKPTSEGKIIQWEIPEAIVSIRYESSFVGIYCVCKSK